MIVYDIFWGFFHHFGFPHPDHSFKPFPPQFQNGLNLLNNYYVNTTKT